MFRSGGQPDSKSPMFPTNKSFQNFAYPVQDQRKEKEAAPGPYVRTKVDDLSAFPVVVRNWLLRHLPTPRTFMGLGSSLDVMSRDGVGLDSEQIKDKQRFENYRMKYVLSSLH
ncbi:hypothetical protein TNCV_2839301 [Trichonephila clavipes]|nr:hypothetical protein TNCV_2839301 [Trichonephila clavipes]